MVACKPTTYIVSEHDGLCLADVEAVSIVLGPMCCERLILKAKGIRPRLLLFDNDLL